MEISKKPLYNLNLVLQETGVKADTLRAWERRYQIPQPNRTEGGHRLFSDYDIATIKWLISRQGEGMRISQAADLWREIVSMGNDPLSYDHTTSDPILDLRNINQISSLSDLEAEWVEACLSYNENHADQVLSLAFAQFPMEIVCSDFIHPALGKIGQYWYEGTATVHQEHYASELATRKLQTLISSAPNPILDKRIIIGCPEGEMHTISSLMLSLIIKYRGYEVTYLGGNTPLNQFLDAVQSINPALVLMSASRLSSAASLLRNARFLQIHNTQVAFGGWIFNQIKELQHLIPGYYLGNDFTQAIPQLINMVNNPSRNLEIAPADTSLPDLIPTFRYNKPKIDFILANKFKDVVLPPHVQMIHDHLGDTIMAALSLGDLDLIRHDLKWAEGLMANQAVPADNLKLFLSSYRDACDESLGSDGEQLSDWLDEYIMNNEWSEK